MKENIKINITVSPRSSRSKIIVDDNDNVKVYLNSPPVDGKANSECISLFSKKLRLPKSSIEIDKGVKGRKKTVLIKGFSFEEIIGKLRD